MSRLITLALILSAITLEAQQWTVLDQNRRSMVGERKVLPKRYTIGTVSSQHLDQALTSGTVDLLLPEGKLLSFEAEERSNFAPGLATMYPNIQTFYVRNRVEQVEGRLDLSIHGMNAVLRDRQGDIYIDVLDESEDSYLIYYTKHDQLDPALEEIYQNHEHAFMETEMHSFLTRKPVNSPFARHKAQVDVHIFDLAVSCTGEYTSKHNGTKEGALAAINTALNRINYVMEKDLAVSLRLIEENEDLIFLDAETDPFTNGKASEMALENSNFLLESLGSAKYDVGHVFGTGCSGVVGLSGGIGTVCQALKGFGASCEISTSDRFYIGVVCHELGHQFGAEHTWNNCPTSDDSQFNSATAFEPGSGSTIMSYAGSCADQNVANSSDSYYHGNSIEDIKNFVSQGAGSGCVTIESTNNMAPTVTIPLQSGFYVPIETPFLLTAQGQDPDGDSITYCWEQFDAGISSAAQSDINNPTGEGPIFRSFAPTESPKRYLPALEKVVNNTLDNREVLPTYDRKLTFRATVRDNQSGGGGVNWAEISFRATQQAGPFRMAALAADTFASGDFIDIHWDVAGTDLLPVNCQRVHIILSTDGGKTFEDTLVANTANDGTEPILIPNKVAEEAHIMVAAADNIFFAVSPDHFAIQRSEQQGVAVDLHPRNQSVCLPDDVQLAVSSFPIGGFEGDFWLIGAMVPEGASVVGDTIFSTGEIAGISLDFQNVQSSGEHVLTFLFSTELGDTMIREVMINTVSSEFTDLALLAPSGMSGVSTRPTFTWHGSEQADGYTLEIDKTPAFSDPITIENNLNTAVAPDALLDESTLYYWRIVPYNACGMGAPSSVEAFHTINLSCEAYDSKDVPLSLTQSAVSQVRSEIAVSTGGAVSDVNVTSIQGFHESFGDLKMSIQSPKGSIIDLVKFECGFSNRVFDMGFDDESNTPFSCQTNFNEISFVPAVPLSDLHGEDLEGTWTLVVSDSMVGSGGLIEGFSLELCGSIEAVDPVIVHSDTLFAAYASTTILGPSVLESDDDASLPEALVYTLIEVPAYGHLSLGGVGMMIGDMFSQSDINSGLVEYQHIDNDSVPDQFVYTLIDGTGGWLGPRALPIVVSDIVSVDEIDITPLFRVFPNPSNSEVTIVSGDVTGSGTCRILSLRGEVLQEHFFQSAKDLQINVGAFTAGIYVIYINTAQGTARFKLMKI